VVTDEPLIAVLPLGSGPVPLLVASDMEDRETSVNRDAAMAKMGWIIRVIGRDKIPSNREDEDTVDDVVPAFIWCGAASTPASVCVIAGGSAFPTLRFPMLMLKMMN
jgi:hypothetical protein